MRTCVVIMTITWLFITKFTIKTRGDDIDYCQIGCPYNEEDQQLHTICMLNHTCEKALTCSRYFNLPFSEKEKRKIVDFHNELRNKIALAKEGCVSADRKPFPPAANMRQIVWDKELEFMAQCWANQCPIAEHNSCMHKFYGNIPVGKNSVWISKNHVIKEFSLVHKECQHVTLKQIEKYRSRISGLPYIGRFTQMIWWNTSLIGCARTRFLVRRSGMRYHITCNYAASGNYQNEPIYTEGKPCSQCPAGTTCDKKYKGLCATEPSQSKVPNICKFAADGKKCVPYLGLINKKRRTQSYQKGNGPEVNYCHPELSCKDEVIKRHTVCLLRHNCGISPKCKNFTEYSLSVSEKREILKKHNELRSTIAMGKELTTKYGDQLPSAANMRELVWDEELEFLAQCWANQCPKSHDSCRKKSDRMESGQNLAWTTTTLPVQFAIVSLFNEFINVTSLKLIDRYMPQRLPNQVGHFTQIAYWNTTQIGCGRSRYHFSGLESVSTLIVCHYAWAGNYEGLEVYQKGIPCSKCPKGSRCHKIYPGLCTTPQSKSKMPDICQLSKNPNCKPILNNPGLQVKNRLGQTFYPSKMPDVWQWPSKYLRIRQGKSNNQ
ncbi:hypothetical protein ILUMI_09858, partial [Ignelater luminosus]